MRVKTYNVNLPVVMMRDRQTGLIVVHSPMLDLSSCGKTEARAARAFGEAVRLFLSELERMGTTEEVLSELGWRKEERRAFPWVPPEVLHQRTLPVRVCAHA